MANLQDKLKYYLGTGLIGKCKRPPHYKDFEIDCELRGFDPEGRSIVKCFDVLGSGWKGHEILKKRGQVKWRFYRLDAITRPIKIESYNDGKEFVPADELNISLLTRNIDHENIKHWELYQVEKLISWHFWIGDQSLFETGEILDKEKI